MDFENKTPKPDRMRMEDLCRAAGLSRSTIYQYLRSGILHPPLNESPTQVRYDDKHLEQLEKIRDLRKNQKLSIPAIKEMLQIEAPEKIGDNAASGKLKDLIFDKAIELFSKNGFAKVKITDITNALNLGKGTFYLYYKNKEELFLECIERFPEIILPPNTWEEIRKERNYFRRTRKRLRFMLEAFPTFMGITSIAKLALRGEEPNSTKKAIECFQTIIRAPAKDLKWAIQNGLVRKIDQEFISFIAFGMGESLGYWLKMNPNDDLENRINDMMDFISHGIMAEEAKLYEKPSNNSDSGLIKDLAGNKIQLQDLQFNKNPYIEGMIGEGKLQIKTQKIKRIEIKENTEKATKSATVSLRSGEMIKIIVDGGTTLAGESSFGTYKIQLSKVKKIEID